MAIIVQKYGGTSLGDIRRLQRVANRVKVEYLKGHQLVVVLSAMGRSTDDLVEEARNLHPNPKGREMDILLSTGEQASVALMNMALDRIQVPAIALTGRQAGIRIIGPHLEGRISSIDTAKIEQYLNQNKVCVIAGFQGFRDESEIYTLGRGGSDTSAVALAVALKASKCEIFTDVDGVYTTDPNKVSSARCLAEISYEEMVEMARLGAGILHSRSVELAAKNRMVLHVRSSFNNTEGSKIMPEDQILEKALVRGVSLKTDEARISVVDIADRPGLAAKLFSHLAEQKISVNMIVQSSGQEGLNTISFTILQKELLAAKSIAQEFVQEEGTGSIDVISEVAILSAVGIGMISHSGIAAMMFKVLADMEANIEMISTSEIKISVVLQTDQGLQALESIHKAFGLDKLKQN